MEQFAGLNRCGIAGKKAPATPPPHDPKGVFDPDDDRVPYTNGFVAVVKEKGKYNVRLHNDGYHPRVQAAFDVVEGEPDLARAISFADRVAKHPDRYRNAFTTKPRVKIPHVEISPNLHRRFAKMAKVAQEKEWDWRKFWKGMEPVVDFHVRRENPGATSDQAKDIMHRIWKSIKARSRARKKGTK